jgi:hypothetical protein
VALHCIWLLIGGWESEVGFVFCFVVLLEFETKVGIWKVLLSFH